ncbi:MAG: ribosome small subunit-dependent GTPase A [Eubacterium sp.]|nr:ribosome small subunit-dependent GTPase A [Eubacterium sp.]
MQGRIIKGIAGFYYVHVIKAGVYECKAKGIFRKEKIKPLVGDYVDIHVISEEEKTGNIDAILPRRNELLRPAVANVDMALIIFAASKPKVNFNLLSRYLVWMQYGQVPVTVCFNKCDLVTEEEKEKLEHSLKNTGYKVLFVSAKEKDGIDSLLEYLNEKTTAVAGPSGVGKSTLINCIQPEAVMETGEISKKIERGKHTTRHSQLIHVSGNTFIMDTPGFSSMQIPQVEKEELAELFPEFEKWEPLCRFHGCSHIGETDCGIKQALAGGEISEERYENYKMLYEELSAKKK